MCGVYEQAFFLIKERFYKWGKYGFTRTSLSRKHSMGWKPWPCSMKDLGGGRQQSVKIVMLWVFRDSFPWKRRKVNNAILLQKSPRLLYDLLYTDWPRMIKYIWKTNVMVYINVIGGKIYWLYNKMIRVHNISIFTDPSARAGYDTRAVF